MRPESLRRACALALACASLLAPGAARAGMGALWNDLVCKDPAAIPSDFHFETTFVGLPECSKLCLDARIVCRRNVDDATSCNVSFANDWISFDQTVDCAGLAGSRLRDCKAGWALDLQSWRQAIKSSQFFGRNSCDNKTGTCLTRCTGQ